MIGQSHLTLRKPVVYVCRDIERALGLPLSTENYYIITNSSAFAKSAAKGYENVLLIKEKEPLDTRELLAHPKVAARLSSLVNPQILVFKNTAQIEKVCAENGWKLLNPRSELAHRVEEKISQLAWLGTLQKYLPPHKVELCENLSWVGKKYIVQFNHAHTGLGTILVDSPAVLIELKKKFPKRSVRVTDFISGAALTNNNVVWDKNILVGNINYQITGLAPFTDNPFTTVGNDWALPKQLMQSKKIKQFKQMATDVGKKLAQDGWRGLFGIDTILDKKTGKLYLIEINARQPASTTFESELQANLRTTKAYESTKTSITTFEAHLTALLGLQATSYKLQAIHDGAQIIQRISNKQLTTNKRAATVISSLKKLGLNVIPYNNTEPGSDWLRIQSEKGIMADHNRFNALGKKIKNILA